MLNSIHLHGNLVADPELRTVGANNTAIVKFTIAVRRNSKNNGEYQADFIPCQAWGARAETIAKYFAKGSSIIVSGTLQNNNYTDSNGNKRYGFIVNIPDDNAFDFVGSNKNSPAARGEEVKPANYLPSEMSMGDLGEFEEVVGDDSLPF